jgi:hypothetical protein
LGKLLLDDIAKHTGLDLAVCCSLDSLFRHPTDAALTCCRAPAVGGIGADKPERFEDVLFCFIVKLAFLKQRSLSKTYK